LHAIPSSNLFPKGEFMIQTQSVRPRRFGVAARAAIAAAATAASLAGVFVGAGQAGADDTAPPKGPSWSQINGYTPGQPGALTFAVHDGTLATPSGAVQYVGVPAGMQDPYTHNSDTYFRGTDNALHVVRGCYDATHTTTCSPNYGRTTNLGQRITSSPVTAVTSEGANLVFMRGETGDLLVYRPGDTARPWQSLGGQFWGDPTAVHVQGNRQVDVFVQTPEGYLYDARSTDNGQDFQWHYVQTVDTNRPHSPTWGVQVSTYYTHGVKHFVFAQLLGVLGWDGGYNLAHYWTLTDPATGARNADDHSHYVSLFNDVPDPDDEGVFAQGGPLLQGPLATYRLYDANNSVYTESVLTALNDSKRWMGEVV
jgi:hypothetical protein